MFLDTIKTQPISLNVLKSLVNMTFLWTFWELSILLK